MKTPKRFVQITLLLQVGSLSSESGMEKCHYIGEKSFP